MHCVTTKPRMALAAVLVGALTSCSDIQSPVGPFAAGGPSLERDHGGAAAEPTAELLVTGLRGAAGSTIGPGGDLFVAEFEAGRISRIDPSTGEVATFASGLPATPFGGGVFDVAFIGQTAYALVSFVTPEAGGSDADGIYRIDGPHHFTVVADIGAFNRANPPETEFFLTTGSVFALEPFRGGFLVTDGHLNRVLYVTREGEISVFRALGNVVPTGLEVHGNTIYMAEAGPIPHEPETGRVVAFGPGSTSVTQVASGARLMVDVEAGRGQTLFGLSQGIWDGAFEGSPALPNTGALVRVNEDHTFSTVVDELDRPMSLSIIGNTAYVVTLAGEVWTITNIAKAPFGHASECTPAGHENGKAAGR